MTPRDHADILEDHWQRESDAADTEAETGLTREEREEIAAEKHAERLRDREEQAEEIREEQE